jgi:RNA polymerase sigma-70 factor, ECF subfamily
MIVMAAERFSPDGCLLAALVRCAQAGDRAAFERLARRYRAAVLAITFARTGHREEAEDLAQEVMLHAWEKLPALREPARFAGWLRAVALNVCRSWYRRSRPWPVSLDDAPEAVAAPDPGPGPLEALLLREKERAWRQALLALPAPNRYALLMHTWGSYSYAEIAAFLEVPVTTVEGRIYRAKRQLRDLLRADAAELLGEPRRQWQAEEERE